MSIVFETADFFGEVAMESARDIAQTAKKEKVVKCPVCGRPYIGKNALYSHILKNHGDELPEGMSPAQYCFNVRNHKSYGLCVMCRIKHTDWDEEAERYKRFCSPECRMKYVQEAKRRMVAKYGKEHLLNDPKMQEKMGEGRSISGQYAFPDGGSVLYMGSYEADFLRLLDKVYGWESTEIMRCPETFEYMYEGTTHLYIPDYYLPNFNLIVEIKSHENKHHKILAVDRVKEAEKIKVMQAQEKFNYIEIVDMDYAPFNYMIKLIKDCAWEDPEFKGVAKNIVFVPAS